jgi:acetyl-CoA synthetase
MSDTTVEAPVETQTIGDILRQRACELGSKAYIHYGPENIDVSYSQMNESANTVATGLLDHGIEPEMRVSVLLRHPLQTLRIFFGIQKCGAIYSPINFNYKGQPLAYQINDTDPDLLIVEDRYLKRLEAIIGRLTCSPQIVVWPRNDDNRNLDGLAVSSFAHIQDAAPDEPDVGVSWNSPSSIIYTSGTTGKPKGVKHTTGGYLSYAAWTSHAVLDVKPDDNYWCAADIGWITGHSYIVYGPLALGTTSVMYEGTPDYPDKGRLWKIVEDYDVTQLYTAPTAIRAFMK